MPLRHIKVLDQEAVEFFKLKSNAPNSRSKLAKQFEKYPTNGSTIHTSLVLSMYRLRLDTFHDCFSDFLVWLVLLGVLLGSFGVWSTTEQYSCVAYKTKKMLRKTTQITSLNLSKTRKCSCFQLELVSWRTIRKTIGFFTRESLRSDRFNIQFKKISQFK